MNDSQSCPGLVEMYPDDGVVLGLPTCAPCALARGHLGQCSSALPVIDWVTEQLDDPAVRKTVIDMANLIPNGPNRKVTVVRGARFFDEDDRSHISRVITEDDANGRALHLQHLIPTSAEAYGYMSSGPRGTFTITVEFEPDQDEKLRPCDREIWDHGHEAVMFYLNLNVPAAHAEQWVKRVAEVSGQRCDWSFFGGIAVMQYIGDHAKVMAAVDALEGELDGRIMKRWPDPEEKP